MARINFTRSPLTVVLTAGLFAALTGCAELAYLRDAAAGSGGSYNVGYGGDAVYAGYSTGHYSLAYSTGSFYMPFGAYGYYDPYWGYSGINNPFLCVAPSVAVAPQPVDPGPGNDDPVDPVRTPNDTDVTQAGRPSMYRDRERNVAYRSPGNRATSAQMASATRTHTPPPAPATRAPAPARSTHQESRR